jgi:VCBS repeat-containing protein
LLINDTDVDTGDTKVVSQIQGVGSAVPVTAGSTSTTSAVTATGSYGQLKLGADGSYTYVVDNSNATV